MSSAKPPSAALISALTRVLRPLVKFMLARGITLPFLTQLLKQLYVEVAEHEFKIDDKVQTDSRISMLTGVHRKDVRRLRNDTEAKLTAPIAISLGAQVVSSWLTERRYLDKQGRPKQLRVRSSDGNSVSFDALVASVSRQDLRPRVVLDELQRLGIVEIDGDYVRLIKDAFIPSGSDDEKLHYFAQNLRDHIAAASANLQTDPAPYLERAVTYHGLTAEDVEQLRELSTESANASLKALDKRARQLKKRSAKKEGNNQRINFGSYFFSGDEKDER